MLNILKKYLDNSIVIVILATALIIGLQLVAISLAHSAPSSEVLLDVQDSTVSGSLISGKRVKDAGNIADNSTSGLLSCGNLIWDGSAWDKWTGASTITGNVTVIQPTASSLNATVVIGTTTTQTTGQVSIPVTAGGTLLIASNTSRKSLLIQNIGSFAMFCGNTGLSATTGYQVVVGASFLDDTAVFTGAVYCIGSGGTTTAVYREVQ